MQIEPFDRYKTKSIAIICKHSIDLFTIRLLKKYSWLYDDALISNSELIRFFAVVRDQAMCGTAYTNWQHIPLSTVVCIPFNLFNTAMFTIACQIVVGKSNIGFDWHVWVIAGRRRWVYRIQVFPCGKDIRKCTCTRIILSPLGKCTVLKYV